MITYIPVKSPASDTVKTDTTFDDMEPMLHELMAMTKMLLAFHDTTFEGGGEVTSDDFNALIFAILNINARAKALNETYQAAHANWHKTELAAK